MLHSGLEAYGQDWPPAFKETLRPALKAIGLYDDWKDRRRDQLFPSFLTGLSPLGPPQGESLTCNCLEEGGQRWQRHIMEYTNGGKILPVRRLRDEKQASPWSPNGAATAHCSSQCQHRPPKRRRSQLQTLTRLVHLSASPSIDAKGEAEKLLTDALRSADHSGF